MTKAIKKSILKRQSLELFCVGSLDLSILPDQTAKLVRAETAAYLQSMVKILSDPDLACPYASHNQRIGVVVIQIQKLIKDLRKPSQSTEKENGEKDWLHE